MLAVQKFSSRYEVVYPSLTESVLIPLNSYRAPLRQVSTNDVTPPALKLCPESPTESSYRRIIESLIRQYYLPKTVCGKRTRVDHHDQEVT
jgi:hypothetical protein